MPVAYSVCVLHEEVGKAIWEGPVSQHCGSQGAPVDAQLGAVLAQTNLLTSS